MKSLLLTTCLLLVFATLTQQQGMLEGVLKFLIQMTGQSNEEPQNEAVLQDEYDFIIVGAGTAGCVLANRLTENPEWNVLLIEAGDQENLIMDFPLLANYLQFTSSNWKYQTIPSDKYCLGMKNKQCNWPRGKVMGGSSVLNYMIYTRGNRRDYDNWAKLGNEGWSYQDLLPLFKKIENFTIPELQDPEYHATDGYLNVGYIPERTKLAQPIVEANEQYGIKYVDYNAKTQVGVSYLQTTIKDGLRHSSNKAYLFPIRNRRNLHVTKLSMVSKILIDQSKRAYGVEMVKYGNVRQIRARKEVLLSAGAINTPQLLMLSGIGPKKHLQAHNIPVIQNLYVGFNLMDHIATAITFIIDKPYTLSLNKAFEGNHIEEYLNYQKGILTIPGGCEVLTFYDFKDSNNPDGWPDIELLWVAGSMASDPLLKLDFGVEDSLFNATFKVIENKNSFSVMPMLLLPKSKGRVGLKDAKYTSKPLLYPNYFEHPEDIQTLIKGIRLAINITKQPALAKLGTKLHDIPIPDCAHHEFASDAYFECHIRHIPLTIYHLSGTCKMGPKSDKRAVVDPRLKVYGIDNLRVADASIMPEVIAGHTNSPVYLIAEKAAQMIKEDWNALP